MDFRDCAAPIGNMVNDTEIEDGASCWPAR
jgi:hypothetical protein